MTLPLLQPVLRDDMKAVDRVLREALHSDVELLSWFTEELRLPAALLIILVVLLVRPQGIFGKPEVKRV